MKRRNLNPDPDAAMRDLVERLSRAARQNATRPAGVKDLGESGDIVWPGAGPGGVPVEKSVKRFAVELDDTTARAEQLAADLAASLERLGTAEQNLTTLRDTTLPAMREALEGADQEASEALTAAVQRLADAEGAITTAQGDLTSLRALLDNTDLADLEARLAAALADIEHFQTVTMPALDQRLADAEQIIAELEGIDIADLTLRLGANETGLAELRETTLPALEQTIQDRITTTRSELDGELAAATGQIGQARQDLDTAIGRLGEQDATLAEQNAALAAQQARIDEVARMTSRGLLPPKGAPLGSHWITPAGHLYVRVPCEEVA